MTSQENIVLICPRNDEESLMILKLAEKLGLAVLVSKQPHGAKLDREKKLEVRIRAANPDAERVIIVEIPGPGAEDELRASGLDVAIIDHHRYDGLDRMQSESSLEQFIAMFQISDDQLTRWGFEAELVRAVGVIDRGFVWALKDAGYVGENRKRALAYYRELTEELGVERRAKEELAAKLAWSAREERDGVIIIRGDEGKVSIRDALSFIVAQQFDEPRPVMIIQGKRRMYVQDTPHAKAIYDKFGGFTFGQDRCWGILKEDGDLPSVDEVLRVVVS